MDKIEIIKTPMSGYRASLKDLTKEQLFADIMQHRHDVARLMNYIATLIIMSSIEHDWSKQKHFLEFYTALISENVKDSEWYRSHVKAERHHLLSYIPDDVDLIDVIEYISDCIVAGLTREGEMYPITFPPGLLEKAVNNFIQKLINHIIVKESDDYNGH